MTAKPMRPISPLRIDDAAEIEGGIGRVRDIRWSRHCQYSAVRFTGRKEMSGKLEIDSAGQQGIGLITLYER